MGINKFGFKLCTVPFAHDSTLIDNNPYGYSDSIVMDTAGWVQLKNSFIADSAYEFIAFGVFFADSLLSMDSSLTHVHKTNYYIDDVCLSSDSLTCNFSVVKTCFPNGISENLTSEQSPLFPNPFDEFLILENTRAVFDELFLYDMMGRTILQRKINGSEKIDTGHLSAGLYFFSLFNNGKAVKSGKIMKEE